MRWDDDWIDSNAYIHGVFLSFLHHSTIGRMFRAVRTLWLLYGNEGA